MRNAKIDCFIYSNILDNGLLECSIGFLFCMRYIGHSLIFVIPKWLLSFLLFESPWDRIRQSKQTETKQKLLSIKKITTTTFELWFWIHIPPLSLSPSPLPYTISVLSLPPRTKDGVPLITSHDMGEQLADNANRTRPLIHRCHGRRTIPPRCEWWEYDSKCRVINAE